MQKYQGKEKKQGELTLDRLKQDRPLYRRGAQFTPRKQKTLSPTVWLPLCAHFTSTWKHSKNNTVTTPGPLNKVSLTKFLSNPVIVHWSVYSKSALSYKHQWCVHDHWLLCSFCKCLYEILMSSGTHNFPPLKHFNYQLVWGSMDAKAATVKQIPLKCFSRLAFGVQ